MGWCIPLRGNGVQTNGKGSRMRIPLPDMDEIRRTSSHQKPSEGEFTTYEIGGGRAKWRPNSDVPKTTGGERERN